MDLDRCSKMQVRFIFVEEVGIAKRNPYYVHFFYLPN